MLELRDLDKYFFKGKKNQIHVIDHTTLTMEDKGLVALLGPSGCGKTTLLNVIGGLDGPGKGDVFIDGKKITHRSAGTTDALRSLNIGYIFQNYNLIEGQTVFENVAIALRMVGVRNEKEIEEKVNYVLEKTGLSRYKSRTAEMLSGGERQRVGIARAIVKDPAIVIADEPTGNLDSRNTIEIMNIIKTISREKLVILVTHEEDLARFCATRIIRIRDGKVISDEVNEGIDGLDYRMDHKVYLQDIPDHRRLRSDAYSIDFYNEASQNIELDIVIQNGSILIRNKTPGSRLEVVDENSPIEFIDGSYKGLGERDEEATAFDVSKLAPKGKRKYRSIIGPFRMLRTGYRQVMDYGALKKILLAGFVISALFVTYAVCNIFGMYHITDEMFVTVDKDYLSVVSKHTDVDEYLGYEQDPEIDYVMPGDSRVNLMLHYDTYLQTSSAEIYMNGSLSDVSKVEEQDLLYGALPQNEREIIVDKMTIKDTIKAMSTVEVGLGHVKDYLGCTVKIDHMGTYTIAGISNCHSPCIYFPKESFIDLLANSDLENDYAAGLLNYHLVKSTIQKTKGDWPDNDYEVMVNDSNKDEMKIGKTLGIKVNGHKLKVVGYFKDARDSEYYLVSPNTMKYKMIRAIPGITISPKSKNAVYQDLRAREVNVKDTYRESKKAYLEEKEDYTRSSLILALVILAISCIEIYIIMRASFLSRIKEVGVYRAIGVKKGDIYRMFTGEILTITALTSLPGFLFMFYIIYRLSKVSYFSGNYLTTPLTAAVSLGIIVLLNLLFGLLPVFRTIRKKPAVILARTDIN